MGWKNKETANKYHREYYKKRMNGYRERLGNKCSHCGYCEVIEILEFAHKKDSIKSFEISTHRNRTNEAIEEELLKCILLCPNCHCIFDRHTG